MHTTIKSAPLIISDRIENEMALSVTELCAVQGLDKRPAKNGPPCQCGIKIGIFFDGTNNNKDRDEPNNGHTNVVKLFNAHKDVNEKGALQEPYHYKFYVPGVGTPFPANRELGESARGNAFGEGGAARILFGLLQVCNAVYRTFNEDIAMFHDLEIATKLQQYAQDLDNSDPLNPHAPLPNSRSWLNAFNKKITPELIAARIKRPWPDIAHISLSVIGFSRGAAQARAFCYWFSELLSPDNTFAGLPVSIDFLGLFDSVSSIGPSQSIAETLPFSAADGHWSWAKQLFDPLPDCVKQTVHFIAAHEQRRNFPLTRVKGHNVTEVLYPGVHSDVGGAYAPGDQGRAMRNNKGETGLLVAQVALAHMHRAASKAGVALAAYCVMDERLKKDYIISPRLAVAWNDYMAAGQSAFEGVPGDNIVRTYRGMVRKHMALYYAFRRLYLGGLDNSLGYSRANPQAQEDLQSYNVLLRGDVGLLRQRAEVARVLPGGANRPANIPGSPLLQFSAEPHLSVNAWQLRLAKEGAVPGPEELWALEEMMRSPISPKTPFLVLLEEYLHDSLASFSIAGYQSNLDKAEELLSMATDFDNDGEAPTTPYRSRVWKNYQDAIKADPKIGQILQKRIDTIKHADNFSGYRRDKIRAQERAEQQIGFSPAEQATLAEFFPTQGDVDVAELRNWVIRSQTRTRREGSGYLRQRHVFE
ncbi:T6SS phospholipase effector Tle1-like catalytic domain-containing protein [Glaciimonas immobilis]|uniref:T6SS Phospholipase effector Tle1-like catalytic domain-containing protein n=1 Tax=Glaciimonas immobilis TaxID=728004 RepID=A0A840RXD8_9BURK|nr:DUF2235 domain-containing protein [Glaciimonas immobilis]KAF3996746.1 DUF2235 domain-containing protein [Glaciimonas immobilis]MBB5201334.1 hypothetical protein [Glaciimonas immobilis]